MPAPHHPHSPPATPARWFVFGGWVFDITAAAILRDPPPGSETATIPLLGPASTAPTR